MIANSFNIDTSNPKPGKPGFIFRGGRFYDGRGGGVGVVNNYHFLEGAFLGGGNFLGGC